MARQIVFSVKAAKPPATYSQAVKAGGLIFISGTSPHDPVSGTINGTTIQEQTRQCLTNISAILEEAGSSIDKIVSVTIVLADEDDFAGMRSTCDGFRRIRLHAKERSFRFAFQGLRYPLQPSLRPNNPLHRTHPRARAL